MSSLFLVVQQEKEREILSLYFSQKGFQVLAAEPAVSVYVKCLKQKPDLLFMELPQDFGTQSQILERLQGNPRTSTIPVLAYGNHSPAQVMPRIPARSVTQYYSRPLKIGGVVESLELLLGNPLYQELSPHLASQKEEVTNNYLNKTIPVSRRLNAMINRIGRFMAFPFTLVKLSQINNDSDAGVPELVRIIKTDSAVATCILKVANSPFFSARGRRIYDLKEAVVRIGFDEVRNIAMSLSALNMTPEKSKGSSSNPTSQFDRLGFWQSSLACGLATERIAARLGRKRSPDAFLAGLLHEFGLLVIHQCFPEVFTKLTDHMANWALPLQDAEAELLGFMDTELTAALLENWNLPKAMSNAITRFRSLSGSFYTQGQDDPVLCKALSLASSTVKALRIGTSPDSFVYPVKDEILREAGMGAGKEDRLFAGLITALQGYAQFLKLDTAQISPETPANLKGLRIGLRNHSPRLFEPHLWFLESFDFHIETITKDLPDSELRRRCDVFIVNQLEGQGYAGEFPNLPTLIFQDFPAPKVEIPAHLIFLPKRINLARIEYSLAQLAGIKAQ